jgi:hypothetical protein
MVGIWISRLGYRVRKVYNDPEMFTVWNPDWLGDECVLDRIDRENAERYIREEIPL